MSPATTTNDVHIGDVGTEFVGEVQDRGVAFNPTGATKSQLLFKTPAGILLTRDANITTTGAGADQKWFLTYEVVQADSDAGLHVVRGRHYWQGYFEFAGGEKFHTAINSYLVDENLS